MRIYPLLSKIMLASMLVLFSVTSIAGTKFTAYVNDALGSPVVAMNQAGDVVWRKTYQPYGKSSGNDRDNRIGYTGHVEDQPDLVYARARYYDPALGRFLSDDPVRFSEKNTMSFNRYAYANNNPYKFVDPNGRDAQEVFNAIDGISMGMMATGIGLAPIPGADLASLPLIGTGAVLKGGVVLGRVAVSARAAAKAEVFAERTSPELRAIFQWGKGLEGVQKARAGLNAAEMERIQGSISKAEVESVQKLYGLAAQAGRGGAVAPEREKLMSDILQKWK